MKHLKPELLAAAADGQDLSPAQHAHLDACPLCSAELAELRALLADLTEVPAPPKALHQETLRRIGLAPRQARGWSLGWAWAGGLVAAGTALMLTLPSPLHKANCPATVPNASGADAGRHQLGRSSQAHLDQPGTSTRSSDRTGLGAPELAAVPAPAEHLDAVGQIPLDAPQAVQSARNEGADAKATPPPATQALRVSAVRGNLLRPAMGDRLSVELELGEAGLLTAKVFDGRGRLVADLLRAQAGPGRVEVDWDGQTAPSGAYQMKLAFEGHQETVKILLVR